MTSGKSFRYYGFVNITFSFLVFYFAVSLTNDALNTIIPALEQMHGWTRGQITSSVTAGALVSIFLFYVLGTLTLRLGVRRVMTASLLIVGIATILMARTSAFGKFSIYIAIVQMFAAGLMLLPAILLSNWFVKKRGRALGLATIGAPFGGATFNLIVGNVMMVKDFAFAYTCVGIAVLILAVVGYFLIENKPDDVGLAPDGVSMSPEEIEEMKKEMENRATDWEMKKIFTARVTWLYMISFGLLSLIITGIMSQLIPRLLDVGIPMQKALLVLTCASILGMGISYLWGWLDDKISTRKTCIIFAMTFAVCAFSFLFASADSMGFVILAIVCLASLMGGMPNLEVSIVASIYGRKEFVNVSRYIRVVVNVFRSLGYAAMGVLYDFFGSYNMSYILFIVFAIIAAVLIYFIKPVQSERRCPA